MTTQPTQVNSLSQLPKPPANGKGLTLSQLPSPPKGVKGMTLDQVNSQPDTTTLGGELKSRLNDAITAEKGSISGKISAPSAGLQMAGALGGGINDVVSSGLKTIGVDKLISIAGDLIPTLNPNTGKITSIATLMKDPTYQSQIQSKIKPISDAWNKYTQSHPEQSGDVRALGNIIGATLNIIGAEGLTEDLTTGARKLITPMSKAEKIAIGSQVVNAPEEIGQDATDAIKSQRAHINSPDENISASATLGKKYVGQASEKLSSVMQDLNTQKVSALAPVVKNEAQGASDIFNSREKDLANLSAGTANDRKFVKAYKDLFGQEDETLGGRYATSGLSIKGINKVGAINPTLGEIDKFVDDVYANGWVTKGSITEKMTGELDGLVKDQAPSEYAEANAKYREARSANEWLKENSGESKYTVKGQTTRNYTSSENVLRAATKANEETTGALNTIKKYTGISLGQKAQIARFVEDTIRDPNIAKFAEDATTTAVSQFGRLRFVRGLIESLQDPENKLFDEIDKQAGGNISKLATSIGNTGKNTELTAKQLAIMLVLGQVQNKTEKSLTGTIKGATK